jgi:PAS domain S-box-containing protein
LRAAEITRAIPCGDGTAELADDRQRYRVTQTWLRVGPSVGQRQKRKLAMASPEEFAKQTTAATASAAAAPSANDVFESLHPGGSLETDELRRFLDRVCIAIVAFKAVAGEQRIVYANGMFENLMGQSQQELRGRGWSIWEGLQHEDQPQLGLGRALLEGEEFVGTFKLERGARPLLVEAYTTAINNDDGSPDYRIVALIDITQRERVQREEFARRLREKETLLLELQHRVKNNLQIVTALIRLEARSARHGEPVNLEKLAGRIEALKLLYQDLSEGAGQAVDLGHYVSEIATALINAYAVDGVRLDLKVEHTPGSINVAMPVGLLVNELVTNAFKYAFADRQKGTIQVRCLQLAETNYQIVVADDGVGLPDGMGWPVPGKIGALVLQTLKENADTVVNVETAPDKGTKVVISFQHTRPVPRPN